MTAKPLANMSIQGRVVLVRQVRRQLAKRSRRIKSPFGIISFGSCVYGFRRKNSRGVMDVDNFLIVPKDTDYVLFRTVVCKIIPNVKPICKKHFKKFRTGEYGILRMYGHSKGVKIGFRVLLLETFLEITSKKGMSTEVLNVSNIEANRTIVDAEPIIGEPGSYTTQLKVRTIPGESKMLGVQHYILSGDYKRLGVLGQKLLMSQVTYDPFRRKLHKGVMRVWEAYVILTLQTNPKMPPRLIIDKLIRSEKFSLSFRKKLTKRINRISKNFK